MGESFGIPPLLVEKLKFNTGFIADGRCLVANIQIVSNSKSILNVPVDKNGLNGVDKKSLSRAFKNMDALLDDLPTGCVPDCAKSLACVMLKGKS